MAAELGQLLMRPEQRWQPNEHRKAERKMGEMLIETERARGAREPGTQRGAMQLPDITTSKPTLADPGLTKRESSEARMLLCQSTKQSEA